MGRKRETPIDDALYETGDLAARMVRAYAQLDDFLSGSFDAGDPDDVEKVRGMLGRIHADATAVSTKTHLAIYVLGLPCGAPPANQSRVVCGRFTS